MHHSFTHLTESYACSRCRCVINASASSTSSSASAAAATTKATASQHSQFHIPIRRPSACGTVMQPHHNSSAISQLTTSNQTNVLCSCSALLSANCPNWVDRGTGSSEKDSQSQIDLSSFTFHMHFSTQSILALLCVDERKRPLLTSPSFPIFEKFNFSNFISRQETLPKHCNCHSTANCTSKATPPVLLA